MLEVTSYGLSALAVILVAAFCFLYVEEKLDLQANSSPSLVDDHKTNLVRSEGNAAVDRSRTESSGREERTGLALSVQMRSPVQGRTSCLDGSAPPRERETTRLSHG